MKCIFLYSIAIIASLNSSAQSLAPDVINTAGKSFTDGVVKLDWTLGEPVIFKGISGSTLTQGFLQPNLTITSVNDITTDYIVTLFPNPTAGYIQLEFKNLSENISIELNSIEGRLLFSNKINTPQNLQIDLNKYAAGTYLLNIKDNQTKIKTYQIIKSR
jgi:hypothetical protein